MSFRDRTSTELPRALSGSKELMASPGVTSTWTIAVCGSAEDADCAGAVALCKTKASTAIVTAGPHGCLRASIRRKLRFMNRASCTTPPKHRKILLRFTVAPLPFREDARVPHEPFPQVREPHS